MDATTFINNIITSKEPEWNKEILIYMFASVMEKKGLFKFQYKIEKDGNNYYFYRELKTGKIYNIKKPNMSFEDEQRASNSIETILKNQRLSYE